MDRAAYEPVSVTEVLAEMKDTAELLIDLSYSAVLSGDEEIAEEVLALEERMDLLHLQARMSLLLAARSPDDAEALAPVLGVVGAAEKISDAAADIATVVFDVGLPPATRSALPDAVETLTRATVVPDSPLADRTLGEIDLETATGVRVVAVRRGAADDPDWLLDPGREAVLRADDTLVLRGPEAGVVDVHERLTGTPYRPPDPPEVGVDDLNRAVDAIVLLKNTSELAVDLAYGAVLFEAEDLAREVFELEAEVDALEERFEAWTLRAAAEVDDPVSLRGLMHIAGAAEEISDAALEISEGVLRGLGTHPVIAEAVYESDEVIVRLTVAPDADLDGATLGGAEVGTATGTRIVGVRRVTASDRSDPTSEGDDRDVDGVVTDLESAWELSPGPDTRLTSGDVLLAKGTRAGAARLAEMAGDDLDAEFE